MVVLCIVAIWVIGLVLAWAFFHGAKIARGGPL